MARKPYQIFLLIILIFQVSSIAYAFIYEQQTQNITQTIINTVTVTVNPSGDAWLDELYNIYNYGGDDELSVRSWNFFGINENRRTILKFDLTSLPSGITVLSANLKLYYYAQGSNNPAGRTYYVYRLTETDWVEGTQSGSWEIGSCTWNYRLWSTLAWTTLGGTYTTTNGSATSVPSSFGWMTWDVKDQVRTQPLMAPQLVCLHPSDG